MGDTYSASKNIDLRGIPCPVNLIRARLAIEDLAQNESLHVYLDKGEPQEMVIPGLRSAGHSVEIIHEDSHWLSLMVVSSAR